MLSELAEVAGTGTNAFVLMGKIKNARRAKANAEGDRGRIYADVVCGEGDTANVEFPASGEVPEIGRRGAFALSPRMYQGRIDGFTVTKAVYAAAV